MDVITYQAEDEMAASQNFSFAHKTTFQKSQEESEITEGSFTLVDSTDAEAHRISNNYLFGFKKWKSHITSRPLSEHSEIVRELYADVDPIMPVRVRILRPTNILYVVLIGWWLALLYILIGCLMFLTIIGKQYGFFCMRMAKYFFWPFGKFIHQVHYYSSQQGIASNGTSPSSPEDVALISKKQETSKRYWSRPQTYIWLLFGVPLLFLVHALIFLITWLFVISIPIAKINSKTIGKIMFISPEEIAVGDSNIMKADFKTLHSEIILYTHQSVNFYYYKFTVDGMNVILVNFLVFVIAALILGYADVHEKVNGVLKCILALLAIVPLTYYIGMALASLSAQTSFAVGAILNATFGSIVELILYIITLSKGLKVTTDCYSELVKSALAGTLLVTMLFIPGICMVIGGLKYATQQFNPRSASVSASLLFVSIAGAFAPTLFSKIYGDLQCGKCEKVLPMALINESNYNFNDTSGLQCTKCQQSIFGLDGDTSLYDKHILPLVYACAILLPIGYIIGMVFSLKTHFTHVYEFYDKMHEEGALHKGHSHGSVNWSKIKCTIILLISALLISLCAEIVAENIQLLLEATGISQFFVGVTFLAVIPELPEVVNGIQFSLQNNVSMGIEIGSSTAIQVCLVQIPLIILINLIYPLRFYLVFADVHLWSVIFAVIVMNYTLQDGKSNYFQGSALVLIYLLLMSMYFFTPTPENASCS